MRAPKLWSNGGVRTSVVYATIILVPVLATGLALSASYGRTANEQRVLGAGGTEALIFAQSSVEPVLGNHSLTAGLSAGETRAIAALARRAIAHRDILGLRVDNTAGRLLFSDGVRAPAQASGSAARTAAGMPVASFVTLPINGDRVGTARASNPVAVEVRLPLRVGTGARTLGVLALYLPYRPLELDVSSGLDGLYRNLAVGLALLYLALLAIATSVGQRAGRRARFGALLAERDTLTRLPTRALFRHLTEEIIDRNGGDRPTAIAVVDLDRFKEVNDALGHATGDTVIAELARRLQAEVLPVELVGRLGGDEFGIVLTSVGDVEHSLRRLRGVIGLEVIASGLPLSIEASVGYVVAPEDGTAIDELLQRAEIAMYNAKSQHTGVSRYHASQNTHDAASLGLLGELRHAIDAGELVLHYQPKMNLRSRRTASVEALVRWEHPKQGLLPPGRFVPLAEQTDLIGALGEWVLNRALEDLHCLPDHVAVAVNISARNLANFDFSDHVIGALEQHGVPASRLILEVTETALLSDRARAATILRALTTRGVRISIDDFGSGQTSLGYLSSLPIDELKIDRTFVFDMLDNPADAAIVRSIVDLGHNLSLRVIAEGVETSSVLDGLQRMGCDEAQGFFIARAMPIGPLLQWLDQAEVPALRWVDPAGMTAS